MNDHRLQTISSDQLSNVSGGETDAQRQFTKGDYAAHSPYSAWHVFKNLAFYWGAGQERQDAFKNGVKNGGLIGSIGQ